ncbi:FecR domain-containing protein [Porticoccaceae bacterium LTM1]|nr:FecR domain-containing protein [Porticoccaceae bacterium LTM1]
MDKVSEKLNQYRVARDISRVMASEDANECMDSLAARGINDTEIKEGLEATYRGLAAMESLRNDSDIQAILKRSAERKGARASHARYWIAAAAMLVLTVSALFFVGPVDEQNYNVDRYLTRVGESHSYLLSDGSNLHLNTGTEVLVDINDSTRGLTLIRGEAFFEVAKDPARPFYVEVNGIRVSVLGTAFNVRRDKIGLSISVTDGEVAVHPSDDPVMTGSTLIQDEGDIVGSASGQYRLQAGWSAKFDEKYQLSTSFTENLASLTSWRTGVLSFEGATLLDVVKELNRYSPKKILIEDPGIVDKKINAIIKTDSINEALKAIEIGNSLKIIHEFDAIVIVGSQ